MHTVTRQLRNCLRAQLLHRHRDLAQRRLWNAPLCPTYTSNTYRTQDGNLIAPDNATGTTMVSCSANFAPGASFMAMHLVVSSC